MKLFLAREAGSESSKRLATARIDLKMASLSGVLPCSHSPSRHFSPGDLGGEQPRANLLNSPYCGIPTRRASSTATGIKPSGRRLAPSDGSARNNRVLGSSRCENSRRSCYGWPQACLHFLKREGNRWRRSATLSSKAAKPFAICTYRCLNPADRTRSFPHLVWGNSEGTGRLLRPPQVGGYVALLRPLSPTGFPARP